MVFFNWNELQNIYKISLNKENQYFEVRATKRAVRLKFKEYESLA